MTSAFYEMEEQDVEINPLSLIGSFCNIQAAIKFEGIFISQKYITLQLRLYEANIQRIGERGKRLLRQ